MAEDAGTLADETCDCIAKRNRVYTDHIWKHNKSRNVNWNLDRHTGCKLAHIQESTISQPLRYMYIPSLLEMQHMALHSGKSDDVVTRESSYYGS